MPRQSAAKKSQGVTPRAGESRSKPGAAGTGKKGMSGKATGKASGTTKSGPAGKATGKSSAASVAASRSAGGKAGKPTDTAAKKTGAAGSVGKPGAGRKTLRAGTREKPADEKKPKASMGAAGGKGAAGSVKRVGKVAKTTAYPARSSPPVKPPARAASKGSAVGRAGKVGSSKQAAAHFADEGDFGVPVEAAIPRGKGPDAASGLPRALQGRSGEAGDRTHGVGSHPSGPGSGSGGDVDPDFIGVGTRPISQSIPTHVTEGPASTTGGSEEFASGPPAEGRNQIPPGTHGATSTQTFDTVDHSGEAAATIGAGRGADAVGAEGPDDAAAGEISSGEASGDDNSPSDNME